MAGLFAAQIVGKRLTFAQLTGKVGAATVNYALEKEAGEVLARFFFARLRRHFSSRF
jgi:hypothetical protein